MRTKYELLVSELDKIEVHHDEIRAMNELCYTASETGVIPFSFHDDGDLKRMVQLVKLAGKFSSFVPDHLRM